MHCESEAAAAELRAEGKDAEADAMEADAEKLKKGKKKVKAKAKAGHGEDGADGEEEPAADDRDEVAAIIPRCRFRRPRLFPLCRSGRHPSYPTTNTINQFNTLAPR